MSVAYVEAGMAKRKAAKAKPASVLLVVRCSPEYKEWVERFAASQTRTPSQAVEFALNQAAVIAGFEKPPRR